MKIILKSMNFLNSNLIIKYWNIHKSNSHDHSKKIWNVITLLSWLKKMEFDSLNIINYFCIVIIL